MELKIVNYQDKNWKYYVKYKNQKHMYLKLKQDQIIITAPLFIKSTTIEEFVLVNLPKVIKQLEQLANTRTLLSLTKSKPYIYYFNKRLPIVFKSSKQTKFFISEDYFLVCTTLLITIPEQKQALLKKIQIFLKKNASTILVIRLQYWAKIMQLFVKKLHIRLMKNKWGMCLPNKQEITLNYRLIHFAICEIDYVIIHELSHLVYADHSANFWKLVASYCPYFQESKKILKTSSLGIIDEND